MKKGFIKIILTLIVLGSQITIGFCQETIPIETKSNALVLLVNKNQELQMIYLGKKLHHTDDYKNIIPQFHQGNDYTDIYNSFYTHRVQKIYWNRGNRSHPCRWQ